MRLILAILLLTACLEASAEDRSDQVGVDLKVKPVLCIIDRRTPSCVMDFLIAWQSPALGYYCLHNPFAAAPLRCWSDATAGEHQESRVVDRGFMYWLTGDGDDQALAAVAVEVMTTDTADRRRNRRTRHVWDLL